MSEQQFQPAYVPHDDPIGEARERLLQGLATMATVGEAGARWAAVGIQNRAAERERQNQQDAAAAAAQREADALAGKVRAERQKMADSLDGDWLTNHASFDEAAKVWRTATVHATGDDPVAARAASLAEERLRKIRPDLMDAYDRFRRPGAHGPGMPVYEAMRAAAREVWQTDASNYQPPGPRARPHGNDRPVPALGDQGPAELPAGGWQVLDELDRQVRQQVAELAEHIRPEALDELQRIWRQRGQLPPGDPTELLRAYLDEAVRHGRLQPAVAEGITRDLDAHAAAERARGRHDAGATDNPRTDVDEHSTGQVDSVRRDDGADQVNATAAALRNSEPGAAAMDPAPPGPKPPEPAVVGEVVPGASRPRPAVAQAFPGPLRIGGVTPLVAGKQPAQTATVARTPGRTR